LAWAKQTALSMKHTSRFFIGGILSSLRGTEALPNPKAFLVLEHLVNSAGGKMVRTSSGLRRISICFFFFVSCAANAQTATGTVVVSRTAQVDGLKFHYLTAGNGPAVILLHGYTQTSRMWRPLIPQLAGKFRVIAPDLPGIGDSDIPKDGLDMKNAAVHIHALAQSLHVEKARVVGHDIGLMVAYAYAAMYPNEVEKLVVMDAFVPGVPGWEPYYNNPNIWHFRFHGPTPEALVAGREKTYFAWFWNDLAADKTRSLPLADRNAYVAAYSRPGRMRAAWAFFVAFPQTAQDFAELAKTKLTMPVLAIAGEKASAATLLPQMKLVANNVNVLELKNTGHWVMEERPKETMDALLKFL
jgi:pimeloyl-ACP methyl ester carboxylesterase